MCANVECQSNPTTDLKTTLSEQICYILTPIDELLMNFVLNLTWSGTEIFSCSDSASVSALVLLLSPFLLGATSSIDISSLWRLFNFRSSFLVILIENQMSILLNGEIFALPSNQIANKFNFQFILFAAVKNAKNEGEWDYSCLKTINYLHKNPTIFAITINLRFNAISTCKKSIWNNYYLISKNIFSRRKLKNNHIKVSR